MRPGRNVLLAAATALVASAVGCAPRAVELPGFQRSPYFDEQVRTFTFDPAITVRINAPAPSAYRPERPTSLVIYALPNGNTIAQTIGCQEAEGRDWHFYIQHIGAQTRYLRQVLRDRNLVVAYVEIEGLNWGAWREAHTDSGPRIVALVDAIRAPFAPERTTVSLTAHSGGGSLIFSYTNEVAALPDWIERIVCLDANYRYGDADDQAEKLVAWLQRGGVDGAPPHYLGIVAYDDRNIELNGKKVVGSKGGTYRKTRAMAERMGQLAALAVEDAPDRTHWTGFDGRLDFTLFKNPDNRILHTVLVQRNGFIHALTFGTQHAGIVELFAAPAYLEWVQANSAVPTPVAGG